MSWLERFTLVMRSNMTVLCERFEDPERMLHQLLIDMEQELEAVRHSVAEALADEIQLRKQVDTARKDAELWLTRAKSAIDRNDETSAQAALEQKLKSAERADELTKEYELQQQQTHKLRASVHNLEDKIRQARQRRTLLLARITRADSQRKINAALDSADGRSHWTARMVDRPSPNFSGWKLGSTGPKHWPRPTIDSMDMIPIPKSWNASSQSNSELSNCRRNSRNFDKRPLQKRSS
jgi:phage shock protein A